jgi:allantoin racemase
VSDRTVRIWHQSMTELEELGQYRTTLEAHARKVLSDRTAVSVHGLPAGSYGGLAPSDVLGYPYAYHLVLGHAIEAAYQAEREGYDAFVVGSYSEPFLREIRSLVDIPVASLAESTFLVACSVGKYQALIANSPSIERIVSTQIHKHGLRERVMGVYSLDPPLTENRLSAAYQDADAMIESFLAVARRAIDAGADVVVPAEGVLAELLWANGVDRVDDVPVMDSLGVAWHYAEMMVGLWQRTNLRAGRRWEYPRAPEQILTRVREAAGLEV